ncbi:hypothetical protein NFC81_05570 [Salinispirillum sp. LH 10-3-1]|uniref:Uncharacterized protein n=1 Tax=Salinispirillum sp. LH 10-3-1 TaxID=2952525 RepID=A0AB38YJ21_9GAMM
MHSEAVFFFTDGQVSKEMLYSEFAAVLDGVVPLPHFSNTVVMAVYLQLDEQLNVTALVFFVLAFDRVGRVDPKWNVPLREMAARGKPGPRLGRTSPALICRTQGPTRFLEHLWEPFGRAVHDPYREIERVLRRNRLGLMPARALVDDDVPVLTSVAVDDPSSGARLAVMERELKAARERVRHYQHRDEQWQRKVRGLEQELEAVQQNLQSAKALNQRLEQHVRQLKAEYSKRLKAKKRAEAG